jgi:pilus assembly protein CpaF
METKPTVDRDLVQTLRASVGDEVHRNKQSYAAQNRAVTLADERQMAATFATRRLEDINANRIAQGQNVLTDQDIETVRREVLSLMFGAGGLDAILKMPGLTNAHVWWNRAIVELADGRTLHLGPVARSEEEFNDLIRHIAANGGRNSHLFDPGHPTLSMEMGDGSRMSAVRSVTNATTLSIRRSVLPNVTLSDLCERGTISHEAVQFLGACVKALINIVVGGGTDSGKTTMLRAFTDRFEPNERILTIEDAAELQLHKSPNLHNVVSYESREANSEGEGGFSLGEAARHALRMSPKRVIVGEARGPDEVLALISAMTTGNDGSMSTIHAESAEGIAAKLQMYIMMSPQHFTAQTAVQMIANAVQLVVHLRKRADGKRIVTSIREITGCDGDTVLSNEVFRQIGDVLVPTGVCSDQLLSKLIDVGFDSALLGVPR